MTDQVAYTNPGGAYPGYINVTRHADGSVSVTVRGDPTTVQGPVATLTISAADWYAFVGRLAAAEVAAPQFGVEGKRLSDAIASLRAPG